MILKQQWTSFWDKQQEAFNLHLEARQNSSFFEDFVASDPLNGVIVKDTERKILYGTLGISSGVGLSLLSHLGFHIRRKPQPPTLQYKLMLLSIGGISPFAAHFGVSSYLLRAKERMDAYVKFSKWLRKRS